MGCSSNSCPYVAAKDIVPTVNGCGAESMSYQTKLGKAHPFVAACNFHDTCYCRCTDSKNNGGKPFSQKQCDDTFLKMMLEICLADEVDNTITMCSKRALAFYHGLRSTASEGAPSNKAYTSAVDECCGCSSKPSPVDPRWSSLLRADMTTREPEAYKHIHGAITSIIEDQVSIGKYLTPVIKTISWCGCMSQCGKGNHNRAWCFTTPDCYYSWDYCSPSE